MFEKIFYKLSWAIKMHAFIITGITFHLSAARRKKECVHRGFLPLPCSSLCVNNEPSEIVRVSIKLH